MSTTPKWVTKYARSADAHIAYQVVGAGADDLVFIPQFWSHIEVFWEEPLVAHFLSRLASFSRMIIFDKRGCGLSDPIPLTGVLTLEDWMDDVRVVMDAADSRKAVLLAHSGGGPMAMLFAATHPERTSGLVLLNTYARVTQAPDYPGGIPLSWAQALQALVQSSWGDGLMGAWPTAHDGSFRQWCGRLERLSASPGLAAATLRVMMALDVRPALSSIQAPTLILHSIGNQYLQLEQARYLADNIPGARLLELPGDHHTFFLGDTEPFLAAIEEFVTGHRPATPVERVLATVLFVDIVDSSARAAELGDRRWREVMDQHDQIAERQLHRFRGRLIKTTGDGLLAIFDGPARAISCAIGLRDALRAFDLKTRAGLHTGEIELRGDDVVGMAVHIAARVQASAAPDHILVSRTVCDLVVGSGIRFSEAGVHELKGVPGEWPLYSVSL